MSNERAKILKMVADGTITPEDGERLLDRLSDPRRAVGLLEPETAPGDSGSKRNSPLKYLRIVVEGDDMINVRVPISLIRTGIQLTALLPQRASQHLRDRGIDLSRFQDLHGEELLEALRELRVDVDGDEGDRIRVFCE